MGVNLNFKNLRYRIEYLLFLSLSFIIHLFPRRIILSIGNIIGEAGYYLLSKRRKIALINLDIAFEDTKTLKEKKRIVKDSFKSLIRGIIDIVWLKDMDKEEIDKILEIDPKSIQLLREGHEKKRGIILVGSHFGNWEIMGIAYGYLGLPFLNVVVRRFDNPYIDRVINGYRQKSGNRIIYKDNASTKIIRALKKNEAVGILLDQNTGKGGIFVNFFGKLAATTRAIASFSILTKAPIILATCYPLEDYRYRVVYGPEVIYKKSGDNERDIHEITQQCSHLIEKYIKENPNYWLWGHKRWNKRPVGEKRLYDPHI